MLTTAELFGLYSVVVQAGDSSVTGARISLLLDKVEGVQPPLRCVSRANGVWLSL